MATLASRTAGPLPLADSPLGRTIATTATDIWNDSCAVDELAYAISYGAVGATANPTIVVDVWNSEPRYWHGRVQSLAAELPRATVSDLAWAVVQDMSVSGRPIAWAAAAAIRRWPSEFACRRSSFQSRRSEETACASSSTRKVPRRAEISRIASFRRAT